MAGLQFYTVLTRLHTWEVPQGVKRVKTDTAHSVGSLAVVLTDDVGQ